MEGKLLLRPVEIPDKRLEGIQFPEEVFRRLGAISEQTDNGWKSHDSFY